MQVKVYLHAAICCALKCAFKKWILNETECELSSKEASKFVFYDIILGTCRYFCLVFEELSLGEVASSRLLQLVML